MSSAVESNQKPIVRALASQLIAGGRHRPITVISAPIASGKSTLLDQIEQLCQTSGWTAARPSDLSRNGLRRLLADRRPKSALPRLLLVDNADLAPSAALEELVRAVVRQPGRTSLVLACERMPDVAFSGLRLQGNLTTIGLPELALSPAEASAMVGLSTAETLSPAFQILMDKTEGWVGAWRFIADQLTAGQSLRQVARTLTGDASVLRNYFEEEILGPLPDDIREFITATGLIWPLTDELAGHLHGMDGPRLLLESRKKCAFLIGSAGGRSLRPNPLFAEFLVAKASRYRPAGYRSACLAAAEWFEHESEWAKAAEYFTAAGDTARVEQMLENNADDIFARFGDIALLDSRTARFSEETVLRHGIANEPVRALIRGDYTRIREDKTDPAETSEFARILQRFGNDDFAGVRTAAQLWLAQGGGQPLQRATVANTLVVAHHADLDLADMQQCLELATSEAIRADSAFLNAWSAVGWATYYCELGRPGAAREVLARVLEHRAMRGRVRNTVEVMLAWAEWLLGNSEHARLLIGRSLEPASRHAITNTMLSGWTTAARCVLAESGLDEALALLRRALDVASKRTGERSALLLRIFACQLSLRHDAANRLKDVREEFERLRALAAGLSLGRLFDEELRLLAARLMLESGELREATLLVQTIIRRAHSANRGRRWVEAMLIRIGITIAHGNHSEASRLFWICEAGLGERAIPRLLLEDARLLRPIIPHLQAQCARPGFDEIQRRIVARLAETAAVLGPAYISSDQQAPAVKERVTEMESRILSFVQEGLSNAEIASRLDISPLTVKWHLRNVFRKLNVRSRTAALARLRQLSLTV